MADASSILGKLASRSITGRGLGIDIHNHTSTLLHSYWKSSGAATDCYIHFLERRLLEDEEFKLLPDYIFKTGLSGACECLSTRLPVPENGHFRPCVFQTREQIFHRRKRLSTRAMPVFNYCRCPEISLLGYKADVNVKIFCLDKNSHVSSKVPHTAMDAIRSRYLPVPDSRMLGL